jgi:hypothetical protein
LAEGSSLFGLRPIVRPCRKAAFVWPVDTLYFLLVVSVVCAFSMLLSSFYGLVLPCAVLLLWLLCSMLSSLLFLRKAKDLP